MEKTHVIRRTEVEVTIPLQTPIAPALVARIRLKINLVVWWKGLPAMKILLCVGGIRIRGGNIVGVGRGVGIGIREGRRVRRVGRKGSGRSRGRGIDGEEGWKVK